jgi:hypothetical protein
MNYEVMRRHYCERFTTPPHARFSGRTPITGFVIDEYTIKITRKTDEVTLFYMFLEGNKIIKIRAYQNGHLSNHEVLTTKKREIDPARLEWMGLTISTSEIVYPVKVKLGRVNQVGERIHLTIEITTTFKLYPERKDFFLPCIEFAPLSETFLNTTYWPRKTVGVDSSVSYVLPKGFQAVSMTSEGPDFVSEFEGNSFVGWVYRGETYEYLRRWLVAQMSFLYFFLLYFVIPLSGMLIVCADCFETSVPPTIIAMLCGSYFVARSYLYEKTIMPRGGELVILTTLFTLLLSVLVDFDLILLIISAVLAIFPWAALCFRYRDTRRNREKNDPWLEH